MKTEQIMQILEETAALLNGHFELRSGLHSDRFFQCANLLRYPRIAAELCAELIARAAADCDLQTATAVLSPALGGILVGHEIARALDKVSIFAEKEDNRLVMRRFAIKPGERYIIAEDVITRGGRVQECIDLVERGGGEVAAILVLVDRSAGQARFGYPTHSLLQMAPQLWQPQECPLCSRGLSLVHPGS